jgi:hypothetical protein
VEPPGGGTGVSIDSIAIASHVRAEAATIATTQYFV